MVSILPPFIRGLLVWLIVVANTLLLFGPLMLVTLLKLLIPLRQWHRVCSRVLVWIAEFWISVNNFAIAMVQPTQWRVQLPPAISHGGWYLVISNHQSWADIFVLQRVFNRRIPFLKFFLKQELIWVPLMGIAWWALDFPFMKRYSKELLARRPELRGKDLETTRRACEKFAFHPIAIMNFIEGTRFTAEKHARQQSAYECLLKPKSGGAAFVLNAMGERISLMLDVTIVYHGVTQPSLWALFCGRIAGVSVLVEQREIPARFLGGSYADDDDYRYGFQEWVREIWQEKDRRIAQLRAESADSDE